MCEDLNWEEFVEFIKNPDSEEIESDASEIEAESNLNNVSDELKEIIDSILNPNS